MSSNLSLAKSIRTCNVHSGNANRIQSDRFLNSGQMACVLWNGYNNKGQPIHPDSAYTKQAGCNSSLDRIAVENYLRPQYSSYVGTTASAIEGASYPNAEKLNHPYNNQMASEQLKGRGKMVREYLKNVPQYGGPVASGTPFQKVACKSCKHNPIYRNVQAQAQRADLMRKVNIRNKLGATSRKKAISGM